MQVRDPNAQQTALPKFEEMTMKQKLVILYCVKEDIEKTIRLHDAWKDLIAGEIKALNERIRDLKNAIDTHSKPTLPQYHFEDFTPTQREQLLMSIKNDSETTIRSHASTKDIVDGEIKMMGEQLQDVINAINDNEMESPQREAKG